MTSDSPKAWEGDTPWWPAVRDAVRAGSTEAPAGAEDVWSLYAPLCARAGRFVIGQLGQSLDGRIATAGGHSQYINGPHALAHLHRLRALVDAVVVGVGTAVADDPLLTVRHVAGPQPARVVIDPNDRLPADAKCLRDDGARRIVIGCGEAQYATGIEYVRLSASRGGIAPADILRALTERGLSHILIEGGGQTVSRFLAARCLDRLHLMVAPLVIGAGPVGLSFGDIATLTDALRPVVARHDLPGGDVLFDCAF